MESISETIREPIFTFALLLAIILLVPPIFERIKLPGLVGLLVAGVIFGSSGLGLLNSKSETMILLADIGKIYLMFVAGLEIDLEQFRRTRNRSMGFGFATFAIPLLGGILVGRVFGFEWNTAVLIGSLLASHTLLAYPIVKRLGVVNDEAVTVTIGATIFTDIGALLVLAICLGVNQGDFTAIDLGILLGSLAVYTIVVLLGLDRLGRAFFRRSKNDQGNQFLFILSALFVASVGAQIIGIEKIVGAFLTGLAVNDVIGDGPVKEKVEFVGSVLFIPIFFVDMGLLLDLKAFEDIFRSVGIPLSILAALLFSKFLAAWVARFAYRYSWQQTITMWSLSLPQVAATLAAALIGFQAQIINERVFNSVILLMLVTSIAGPLITARFAAGLTASDPTESETETDLEITKDRFRVVVPVYNPQTERYLLELASLLADKNQGVIVPLAIAKAESRLDSPQLEADFQRCAKLLTQAEEIAAKLNIPVQPELRVEYDIAQGISHASREVNADLIVLGFGSLTGFRSRLFNSVTDSILWSAHCSVAVARLLASPLTIKRILVPVESINPVGLRPVHFVQSLITSKSDRTEITLLHVCPAGTSKERKANLYEQLERLANRRLTGATVDIKVTAQNNFVREILNASRQCELVILRSQRQRMGVDSLALGSTTKPLLENLNCSVVLLGEL